MTDPRKQYVMVPIILENELTRKPYIKVLRGQAPYSFDVVTDPKEGSRAKSVVYCNYPLERFFCLESVEMLLQLFDPEHWEPELLRTMEEARKLLARYEEVMSLGVPKLTEMSVAIRPDCFGDPRELDDVDTCRTCRFRGTCTMEVRRKTGRD